MIYSINAAEIRNQKMSMQKNNSTQKAAQSSVNQSVGFTQAASNALKAQISFGSVQNANGITLGRVEGKQSISATLNGANRIPNNLDFAGDDYKIISTKKEDRREIQIQNKDGKAIIKGYIKDDLSPKTEIKFNVAKHNPEIKVTRGDSSIQLFEGSYIKDRKNEFEFTYPGKYSYFDYEEGQAASDKISFTGTYVSVLCKKDASVKSTNNAKEAPFVVAGQYCHEMREDDISKVLLKGGFGTRFANMTGVDGNKPAFVMPNGQSMGGAAYDVAKNGTAQTEPENITFLNQINEANPGLSKELIEPGDKVIDMEAFASDGGAVIHSILQGDIPKNKPLLILNADTITNIDSSQAYHKLKTLKNAAMVIPCYPVSETRAKSFGLMEAGRLADDEGSRELTSFNEKPKNPAEDAKGAMIKGEYVDGQQAYRGNPGIYLFSEVVLQNLDLVLETAAEIALEKKQKQAIKDGKEVPTSLGAGKFSASTFLGNAFVPAVVKLCQEGRLVDENGNKMKSYIVPMNTATGEQAVWDDVGSAEAFIRNCQDIAYETEIEGTSGQNKYYGIRGLEDFRESAIIEDGVIFASPADREHFENKHAQEFRIKGNAFIRSGN